MSFFFVWAATWGKMLTGDNLRRRGYTIVGWCCMCQCSGSSFHPFCGGGISCGTLFLDHFGPLGSYQSVVVLLIGWRN